MFVSRFREHVQKRSLNVVSVIIPRALDALVVDETVRQVGLSNFTSDLLVEALDRLETPLFAARELTLDPEDIARIDAIEGEHRAVDFPRTPW